MSFDIVVADWLIGTALGAVALAALSLGTRRPRGALISAVRNPLEAAGGCLRVLGRATDDDLRALASSKEVKAFLRLPRTAVYVARRDGFVLWASPGFPQVTGHRAEDLVGRSAWDVFVAPEDLTAAAETSAALTDHDITCWLRLKRADGQKDWFRLDALNRMGGVVIAIRREDDEAARHFHFAPYSPAKR
jgi:PAS domain S-box-containing protein